MKPVRRVSYQTSDQSRARRKYPTERSPSLTTGNSPVTRNAPKASTSNSERQFYGPRGSRKHLVHGHPRKSTLSGRRRRQQQHVIWRFSTTPTVPEPTLMDTHRQTKHPQNITRTHSPGSEGVGREMQGQTKYTSKWNTSCRQSD